MSKQNDKQEKQEKYKDKSKYPVFELSPKANSQNQKLFIYNLKNEENENVTVKTFNN